MEQPITTGDLAANGSMLEAIRDYWNEHIHDLAIARHPVGTAPFFQELDEYRFDKLRYLPRLVDFAAYQGKEMLEVGCGVGIDLARFARAGAVVTGVDLADVAIDLARRNFACNGLVGNLLTMNGEELEFEDGTYDMVYAHGVLQYTADPRRMVAELRRVLRPGGQAILMVYNRYSWLNLLSKVMKVALEHQDAPVLRTLSIWEYRRLLEPFVNVRIVPERFPVRTRLHGGLKGALYNEILVRAFRLLPKPLVRPTGWHQMAFCEKET